MDREETVAKELPNLMCVLCIVGYPLSQCLLSPLSSTISNSTIMSWGYHIFSLFIATVTLWFYRNNRISCNASMVFISIFFSMYIVRAIYDLEFVGERLDTNFAYTLYERSFSQIRFQTYVYVFALTIYQLYVLAKVINYINFTKVVNFIVIIGFFSLLLSTLFSHQNYLDERVDGNATLKNISFANYASVVCLCTLWRTLQGKISFIKLIVYCIIIVICITISLKTGSRGPTFSLLICFGISFLLFFRQKNPIIISVVLTGFFLLYFFVDYESILSERFPLLYARLDRDNRTEIFTIYWHEFLKNKAFGFQLDFLGYSHNMIIDSFMMFGIVGGLIVPIICLNILFLAISLRNKEKFFPGIILIFFFMICNMFSGSLGTNLAFWSLYIIVADFYYKTNHALSVHTSEL